MVGEAWWPTVASKPYWDRLLPELAIVFTARSIVLPWNASLESRAEAPDRLFA
jgi:hypothetical protein